VEREIERLMGGSSERETPSKATTEPEAMNIDQTENSEASTGIGTGTGAYQQLNS
jgi:hypothetical protein